MTGSVLGFIAGGVGIGGGIYLVPIIIMFGLGSEKEAAAAKSTTIPSKLKAVIKFGYDEGWKNAFAGSDFNDWIASVLTHSQAHYKDPSLGTEVTLEVSIWSS